MQVSRWWFRSLCVAVAGCLVLTMAEAPSVADQPAPDPVTATQALEKLGAPTVADAPSVAAPKTPTGTFEEPTTTPAQPDPITDPSDPKLTQSAPTASTQSAQPTAADSAATVAGGKVVSRTETSTTFAASDGRRLTQLSPVPVNFDKGNGTWVAGWQTLTKNSDGSLSAPEHPLSPEFAAKAKGLV
jgi:hypothetical protein